MSAPDAGPGPGPGEANQPTRRLPTTAGTLGGGRYVLGPLLGSGGMGLVRRARDERLHRDVAVKLLADNLAADRDARERFLREARAAARISDPHVVVVHDVGEEDGRPYLVMELVAGPSLADVLVSDGPLPPGDVLDVARATLAGLARAHAAGVLHRDVKPGNLLRTPDGRIKVTDLGVAEAADVPSLTRTGFVVGTRPYLAPERRSGGPASVATDLWALGATLVELLTGEPPGDEPTLPALPTGTPPELAALIARLLAAEPAARPADAVAAAAILATPAHHPSAAREHTAVLPADDVDTIVVEGLTDGDHAQIGHRRSWSLPWRGLRSARPAVAIAAVGLLAALTVWKLADGLGSDAAATAPLDAPARVERVEGDPATTARNLADWLRAHIADD